MLDRISKIIDDEDLLQLYDYWLSKRRGRDMPTMADIDVMEIAELLPNLLLVDIEGDGTDYRLRMVGAALTAAHGFDSRGKILSEVLPDGIHKDYVQGLYKEVVDERCGLFCECEHGDAVRKWHTTVRLLLPLSDDGENVSTAMVGQIFETESEDDVITILDEQGEFAENIRLLLR